MCRAVLAIDKRFSDVRPRHPRGGPDGGRDIEAIFREDQLVFGAVGFVNQANDSEEHKKAVKAKFASDLESAISSNPMISVFVFLTNINLTIGEKEYLIGQAKKSGLQHCEIFDRERIRIHLDSPDGFSIRFQYLGLTLSEEEQASFFARWGDDIQSVISTGFQKIERTLNRVMFLQESNDPLSYLTISFELDKKYDAKDIDHFRLFCHLTLKEPKHNILSILFGSSDKSTRMRNDTNMNFREEEPGIKHGIGSGQWEHHIGKNEEEQNDCEEGDEKWTQVGSSSSIGKDEVEFLTIFYSTSSLIRIPPVICLRDLEEAMFIPFANRSLAEKVKSIHVYSNGYKLQEIDSSDISIDSTEITPNFPVEFDEDELSDAWVRIRPKSYSMYRIDFFDRTPKRMFTPSQVENTLQRE